MLILQVIVTPQGVVPDWQERFRKHFPPQSRFPEAPPLAALAGVPASEQKTVVKV